MDTGCTFIVGARIQTRADDDNPAHPEVRVTELSLAAAFPDMKD